MLSLQASPSKDTGLAASVGRSMPAELVKVGLSLSKLVGAAAALLPSRIVDSCARRTSDSSLSLTTREVHGMTELSVSGHRRLQHSNVCS